MARGQVFRELLALGARQAEPVTAEEGREALRRFRPPEVWSEETLKRRASTAVSWVNWLLRRRARRSASSRSSENREPGSEPRLAQKILPCPPRPGRSRCRSPCQAHGGRIPSFPFRCAGGSQRRPANPGTGRRSGSRAGAVPLLVHHLRHVIVAAWFPRTFFSISIFPS